jgi:hypothetical protein
VAARQDLARLSGIDPKRPVDILTKERALASEKLDNLNRWLTLAANIGVLLGILALIYEIQQNTAATQSQVRLALFAGAQEELWKNMEYPDVTLNFSQTDRELSDNEKVRFDAWMTAAMRAREFAWLEYTSGNISEEHWQTEEVVIAVILGGSRSRYWWDNLGSKAFHIDFVDRVNVVLREQPQMDYAADVLAMP